MNETGTIPNVAEHDADLAQAVASALSKALGQPTHVLSLRRRRCEFATLFPAEQITADLPNGKQVSLFMKQLGEELHRCRYHAITAFVPAPLMVASRCFSSSSPIGA
jgi:hypothetical protein